MRKSLVFFSRTGCLLPLLIISNLCFGWIFLSPQYWLLLEAILILFFVINGYILAKQIFSAGGRHENVVDVEGEMIEDRQKSEIN